MIGRSRSRSFECAWAALFLTSVQWITDEGGALVRGTLFFVHGTGVRQAGLDRTLAAVRAGLEKSKLDGVGVVAPAWGPRLGVPVSRIAQVLPGQARGLEEAARDLTEDASSLEAPVADQEVEAAMWALLVDDPLFELRLVAQADPGGSNQAAVAAVAMLERLPSAPVELEGTDLHQDEVAAAAQAMAAAPETSAAARAVGDATDADLVEAMARAVVATILAAHALDLPGTEPTVAVNAAVRDRLIDSLANEMVGGDRGLLTDWIKDRTIGFAKRKATAMATNRRQGLMAASLPGIGDILYYQRRGDQVRKFVGEQLAGLERPVVAVGHSLGGIILVDLLTQEQAPVVDRLITVGSQSPLFFAIDALDRLRPEQQTPLPFTPWLNIYNRNDLLSFLATGVFPGVDDITDVEVDAGVPFPESHSAYWQLDDVFELIKGAWPADPVR
jgi:hypothetical protein